MPKKPKYKFERSVRAKVKATKKVERLQSKIEKSQAKKANSGSQPQDRQV